MTANKACLTNESADWQSSDSTMTKKNKEKRRMCTWQPFWIWEGKRVTRGHRRKIRMLPFRKKCSFQNAKQASGRTDEQTDREHGSHSCVCFYLHGFSHGWMRKKALRWISAEGDTRNCFGQVKGEIVDSRLSVRSTQNQKLNWNISTFGQTGSGSIWNRRSYLRMTGKPCVVIISLIAALRRAVLPLLRLSWWWL